jgi:hypothetical protein
MHVSLTYPSEPPSHFVARLGNSGWLEGGGWTIEDALTSLAACAYELAPPVLIEATGQDRASIFTWLSARVHTLVLDE